MSENFYKEPLAEGSPTATTGLPEPSIGNIGGSMSVGEDSIPTVCMMGGAGSGSRVDAPVLVGRAQLSDVPEIVDLIKGRHRYHALFDRGITVSEQGFLLAEMTAEQCLELVSNETVFVAKVAGKVVGFLIATGPSLGRYELLENPIVSWSVDRAREIYEANKFLYLWIISVSDQFQGRGVGKGLINEFMSVAATNAVAGVIVDFMDKPILNNQSRSFFQSVGFCQCGYLTISDYYGVGDSGWRVFCREVQR